MRRFVLLCAALLCALGFTPSRADDAPTATPDPNALSNSVIYWDVGLALNYPAAWQAPLFTNGQLLLGADPLAALNGTVEQPVVALRLIEPSAEFDLPKGSDLAEIALHVNLTVGNSLIVHKSGKTSLADLDAGFVEVENPERRLLGQTIVALLPDGRYVALSGVSPNEQWANFVVTFFEMRKTARLLSARDVTAPPLGTQTATFAGLAFRLPQGWRAERIAEHIAAYHAPESALYFEGGLANGALLIVVRLDNLPEAGTFRQKALRILDLSDSAPLSQEQLSGRPALRYEEFSPISQQHIASLVIERAVGRYLLIRWSTPLAFYTAYQPLYRAILDSMRFLD
ncbi:MAG: hypothetical protein CUN49_06395 [Candidatus Thermofonsia Clade 1 bacterium]|jgi:hypothetical protein|uniref:PsbP C-terminal domain-containing protein n=1 Tax=Candidatus Thermofonsia Clade 1 bacterium TaxID=2364210 RepID=A0A2M8PFC2_9CHLR|nr:MAG: hypothetical protein CUN49_06395 [Candidatus Thermofonsia Clade 1 bacterium]RMF53615.1 MAG: hypothetical protein D6749_01795 [Chloroflexota bacterium]